MSSWRIGLLFLGIFLIVIGWYMKNQKEIVIIQKEQVETICGTGIGLPVGTVCLGLASIVGGTGALVGYLIGKATEQKTIMVDVPMEVPAYDSWLWIGLLLIGTVCIITAVYFELKKRFQQFM